MRPIATANYAFSGAAKGERLFCLDVLRGLDMVFLAWFNSFAVAVLGCFDGSPAWLREQGRDVVRGRAWLSGGREGIRDRQLHLVPHDAHVRRNDGVGHELHGDRALWPAAIAALREADSFLRRNTSISPEKHLRFS